MLAMALVPGKELEAYRSKHRKSVGYESVVMADVPLHDLASVK